VRATPEGMMIDVKWHAWWPYKLLFVTTGLCLEAWPLQAWLLVSPVSRPPKYRQVTRLGEATLAPAVKIFVYDAPPHLAMVLELNLTTPRPEMAMESNLLRYISTFEPHVQTSSPDGADFFLVPHTLVAHWVGCYSTITSKQIGTCDFARGWGSPAAYWTGALRPFLEYIIFEMPHFNASKGRDHLFVYTNANGPFCDNTLLYHHLGGTFLDDPFFKWAVQQMIIVGNHGSVMELPDGPAMTQIAGLRHRASRQHCFSAGFDITLPQYNPQYTHTHGTRELNLCQNGWCSEWLQFLVAKAAMTWESFYFLGSFQQLLPWCSPGIRKFVESFCTPSNSCSRERYGGIFALAPAGTACWSTRFFDAVDNLAVPVIMADPIVEPFEQFIDYELFVPKIRTESLPDKWTAPSALPTELVQLRDEAEEFWEVCAPTASQMSKCLASSVAKRVAAIVSVRPWLTTPRGMTRLFLLELACRTAKPPSVCDLPNSARLAFL